MKTPMNRNGFTLVEVVVGLILLAALLVSGLVVASLVKYLFA